MCIITRFIFLWWRWQFFMKSILYTVIVLNVYLRCSLAKLAESWRFNLVSGFFLKTTLPDMVNTFKWYRIVKTYTLFQLRFLYRLLILVMIIVRFVRFPFKTSCWLLLNVNLFCFLLYRSCRQIFDVLCILRKETVGQFLISTLRWFLCRINWTWVLIRGFITLFYYWCSYYGLRIWNASGRNVVSRLIPI